jgi:hypothetical protein
MPPRRSARVADAAEHGTTALSPLPLVIVLYIFSLLPVDCRLRCAEVCRGWRRILLERSLWTRLNLSATSGVRMCEHRRFRGGFDGLFRCAAARAGGGLHSLHVRTDRVSFVVLLEVAAANAGALQELQANFCVEDVGFAPAQVQLLCGAAPLLRIFGTDLECVDVADLPAVRRALRNEAPFGPLRVRHLHATLHDVDEAGVIALAADVATHASLTGIELEYAQLDTADALDAVVDAALAQRVLMLSLYECGLSPASAPALARLLSSDALTKLACWSMLLLDAPAAAVLAAALRTNSTLTELTLRNARVFEDAAVGAELLGALTGHASLRVLNVCSNGVGEPHHAAVGAAFNSLLVANAPALTHLGVSWCRLGDDGMRLLLEALPANTHLRALKCEGNFMSDAFARDTLLPAVRANASLRELDAGYSAHSMQAAALVCATGAEDCCRTSAPGRAA